MVALRSAVAALFLVLGACDVGEVPPAGGGGVDGGVDPAAQSFNTIVKPRTSRCATAACHGGTQSPNLSDYAKLGAAYKTKPGKNNILVTKGTMTVPVGQHSGMPYLSSDDQTAIANWIDSL